MKNYVYLSVFVLFANFLLFSCVNSESTISSKTISSSEQRILELQKYYKNPAPVVDAEFSIFDVNMNTRASVPGSTSRDYKIILKIDPADAAYWTEGMVPTSLPFDYSWANSLTKGSENFPHPLEGPNKTFSSENKQLVLYENRGILLIRIRQD